MTSRSVAPANKLSRAVVVALVAGQLIAIPLVRFDVIRIGPPILAALGIVAYLATRRFRASPQVERIRLALYLGVPTCIMLALTGPSVYEMSRAVLPLLLGWSAALAIDDWPAESSLRLSLAGPRVATVWGIAAVGLWIAVRPPGHHPIGLDEALYLMQSQYVRHAPFMRPLDHDLTPFFLIRQSYAAGGYINGQYPPGWPLVLSLASNLRESWLLLFAVHVLLIAATYAFGRMVSSPRVGALSAGLVALSGFTLSLSTSFVPHVFEAALALLAGCLMVGSADAPAGRRAIAWALAGLLLGFAIAVRPLTGIALAATLWLWVLLRSRSSVRSAAVATAVAGVGAVVPLAFLMDFNRATTGSLLRFGYDVAEHGLHALGFGMRGFVEYTASGVPTERVTAFGPVVALRYARENLSAALIDFWPTVLIAPILYLASRAKLEWRWRPIAAFAVVPAAYFFYFYHYGADRFYFELLPFAMVATGFLVEGLTQRQRGKGIAVGALLVATMLVDTGVMGISRRRDDQHWTLSSDVVERLRAEHPKLLVFVHSELAQQAADPGSAPIQWWGEPGMQPLYWYNVYGFPSDVVVARDLGRADTVLAQRFPGRYSVVLSILQGPPGGAPWLFDVRQLESGLVLSPH
jgi:hypothetical protein